MCCINKDDDEDDYYYLYILGINLTDCKLSLNLDRCYMNKNDL